ncbi:MAG TPA: ABC transporter permease [Rickettsiales bacterium]|nr:ABC transporter permease [Rickettsiales bacterium]
MLLGNFLKHTYTLGIKEIKSFLNDKIFVIFVIWAFTLNIVIAANAGNLEVKNAAVAVVNEDHSVLSRNILMSLREPYFQEPVEISFNEINNALDKGKYSFVIVIPSYFQANLLAGKPTEIQLNIDATVVSQAYVGSTYIKQIINTEISNLLETNLSSNKSRPVFEQVIRVKYNPNTKSEWFMSIAEVIMMGTILSIMLPAVALVREKESGTIEHLLVMPITPQEIMLSKIWSNSIIILLFAIASVLFIVQGYYGVKIEGSLVLFFIGFIIFQFSITSLGIVLATFANNTAQLALLTIAVMMPMVFLSGAFTPMESMSPIVQEIMFLSPLKHCMDFSFAVIFRAATFLDIWKPMLFMIIYGIILFTLSSLRFKSWFNSR